MPPSLGSFVLHNNLAGSSAGKQRPDQLRGYGLVALRALIPLKAISKRVCVGDREGARRGARGFLMVIPPGAAADDGAGPAVTLCLAVFCRQDEWQDAVSTVPLADRMNRFPS
jgi:hypothetical protein